MFIVAYASPTETQNACNNYRVWTGLDRAVEGIPKDDQVFVLMDANTRTGRSEKGGWRENITKLSLPTIEMPSSTTENYSSCPLLATMT